MEIKDYLIKQARLNNVCFEGYNIMRSSDINGLVDYYLSAPDWCLERDFPVATIKLIFNNFADKFTKVMFSITFKWDIFLSHFFYLCT